MFLVAAVAACGADKPMVCRISTSAPVIVAGSIPNIKVAITNGFEREIFLIGCLDGSGFSGRYPRCWFELLSTEGKPIPETEKRIGCGTLNPLKTTDFVKVLPDADFNPYGEGFVGPWELSRFSTFVPGDYVVRFHYQTSAERVEQFLGAERLAGERRPSDEIMKLFASLPSIEVKSNDLKITVKAR